MSELSVAEHRRRKRVGGTRIAFYLLGAAIAAIEIYAWIQLAHNYRPAQIAMTAIALFLVYFRPIVFESALKCDRDGEFGMAALWKFTAVTLLAYSMIGMYVFFGAIYNAKVVEAAGNSVEAKLARNELQQVEQEMKTFESMYQDKMKLMVEADKKIVDLKSKKDLLLSEYKTSYELAVKEHETIMNSQAKNSLNKHTGFLVKDVLSDKGEITSTTYKGVAEIYQGKVKDSYEKMNKLNPEHIETPEINTINDELSKLASLNTLNVRHAKLKKAINQAEREVIMTGESLNVSDDGAHNETEYGLINKLVNYFTSVFGIYVTEEKTAQAFFILLTTVFTLMHSFQDNIIRQRGKNDPKRRIEVEDDNVLQDAVSKVRSWFSRTRNTKTLSGKTVVAQHGKSNAPAKAQFCGNIERISNKPSPEPSRGIGFMANIDQTPAVRIERGRGKYSNERILELKQMGLNNKQIAEEIGASPQTVGRRIKLMQEQNIIG